MSPKTDQYRGAADDWSEAQYADPSAYLEHRARVIVELGPRLAPGDEVLDLACGDGGLGAHLLTRGLCYHGVDLIEEMVVAARRRLGATAVVEQGDLNTYAPPAEVAATTLFRALYYADDRVGFFRRVAGFTATKLVFDLNPRQYPVEEVTRELAAAGFDRVDLRPFFVPQTRSLPRPLAAALRAAERSGPLARIALRHRFTYVVAASRSG